MSESLIGALRHALVSGVLVLAATSCQSLSSGRAGELVIVGGGLAPDNAEVIDAFVDGAGGTIVVLPTASGVPLESGPGTVVDLERYSNGGQSVAVLDILHTTPERAEDQRYVEALRSADAVWFTGGDQARITSVFRPKGIDTPAHDALQALLARGGRIAGSSAGAAMMSDPMIAGGTSREALLGDTGATDFGLVRGMGFFPFGLVDQHFLRRGRIGRLVAALELDERDFAYGIADNRALAVDLKEATGRPLGERAVVCLDVRGLSRDGRSRLGTRVALLSSGDHIDFESGAIEFGADKHELAPLDSTWPRSFDKLDPFGDSTLTKLLERLSTDPTRPQSAERAGIALVVRADAATQFVVRGGDLGGFSVRGAILDIVVDPSASLPAPGRGRR